MSAEYVDYDLSAGADMPGAVPVDHAWSGARSFPAKENVASYDFAIASQVAQYVPNLLGWFRGLFDVLRVGGVLNLSLPDRRFMFDVRRKPSTLGELLEAYYLDYARPSLRQVVDHTYEAADVDTTRLWNEDVSLDEIPRFCGVHALALAQEAARKALDDGAYVPCHCWVFTPLSFLDLIEDATKLGHFPFVISQFSSTDAGDCEFFVSLRRDAEEDADRLLELQLGAIAHVRGIARSRQRRAKRLGLD